VTIRANWLGNGAKNIFAGNQTVCLTSTCSASALRDNFAVHVCLAVVVASLLLASVIIAASVDLSIVDELFISTALWNHTLLVVALTFKVRAAACLAYELNKFFVGLANWDSIIA
jgi:hypothetical protein